MCVIKPAYSVSFLLSINIFVWQNVLYFPNEPRTNKYCWTTFSAENFGVRIFSEKHVTSPDLSVLHVRTANRGNCCHFRFAELHYTDHFTMFVLYQVLCYHSQYICMD